MAHSFQLDDMNKIVSLAKRRGFVFPGSEIYGGFGNSWDYGPLGVLLKENVKAAWMRAMVQERDDIVPIETAIISSPSRRARSTSASTGAQSVASPARAASFRTRAPVLAILS